IDRASHGFFDTGDEERRTRTTRAKRDRHTYNPDSWPTRHRQPRPHSEPRPVRHHRRRTNLWGRNDFRGRLHRSHRYKKQKYLLDRRKNYRRRASNAERSSRSCDLVNRAFRCGEIDHRAIARTRPVSSRLIGWIGVARERLHWRAMQSLSRCLLMRRWRFARRATLKISTKKREPARFVSSPASTHPMKPRRTRRLLCIRIGKALTNR